MALHPVSVVAPYLQLLCDAFEDIFIAMLFLELVLDFFLAADGDSISYLPVFPVVCLGLAGGG